ncbi:MAG: MBL fold metallo-hydrolase [Deltaproteobacteria bacterium]|nr:MBL fold metallo-hydrolase [Deltaproteobacteria bacterium]
MRLSAVEGNRQKLDGGSMFGNAPRPLWERWYSPDEIGRIELACRAMLIESESEKILCETGIGAFFEPKLAERYGVQDVATHRLLESLEALGVNEDAIDFVILSHLHFDHAGGLLPSYVESQKGKGDLLFPKARYVVGEEAWERCKNPHFRDRASFIPGLWEKLEASGRLLIVPKRQTSLSKLPSYISFRYSDGHTPGHMHTIARGQDSTVCFCGDLIPGTAWVHLPITMGYDRYPEKLIDEKADLYDKAFAEKWLLFFTHDPVVPAAYIRKEKDRFVVENAVKNLTQMPL